MPIFFLMFAYFFPNDCNQSCSSNSETSQVLKALAKDSNTRPVEIEAGSPEVYLPQNAIYVAGSIVTGEKSLTTIYYNGNSYLLSEGDFIADWRIVRIQARKVTFRRGIKTVVVFPGDYFLATLQ